MPTALFQRRYLRWILRWLGLGIRLGGLGALFVHFALTLIYVSPINPIKIALQPLVYSTIGVYFGQNWSFFAPNPISTNNTFLVRPITRQEMARLNPDALPEDNWYDLTSPLWERFHHNRFSAYERLSRPQSNGMRMYLGGGPELGPWMDACQKGDVEACHFYETQMEFYRERATELLTRIASGFSQEFLGSDQDVVAVALRIRTESVVPWSRRHVGKPAAKDLDLGVHDLVRGVAASGIYAHAR
jgi:hypothetical protein